jgi:hypothetical protein
MELLLYWAFMRRRDAGRSSGRLDLSQLKLTTFPKELCELASVKFPSSICPKVVLLLAAALTNVGRATLK